MLRLLRSTLVLIDPTILYFDDKTKKYFYAGIDVGNMSWNDLKMLKKNRKQLGEYKVGIIYVVNGSK